MTGTLIAKCVLRVAAALALLGFAGCTSEAPEPVAAPSFYNTFAQGGQLDPTAAQSMISGYRSNNGLGAVALDPELMKLAEEHSRTMAARDKLDHDVGKTSSKRSRGGRAETKMAV